MQQQGPLSALDDNTRDSIARAMWTKSLQADQLPPDVLAALASDKNRNRAYGERMAHRLHGLLRQPDSFAPSFKHRYETLLDYCDSLSPQQALIMNFLLGGDSGRGYQKMPLRADLQFPRDNAAKLQAQIGWYFCVGSATGQNGKEYGVELMFMHYALLPVVVARHFGLSDVENTAVELQFAISEAGDHHYQAKPILVAGTSGLLRFTGEPMSASMGKNAITSLQQGSLFPLRVQARGTDDGQNPPVDLGIDLTFSSSKGYLIQGDNGCCPCVGGVGTLYYSIPGLKLDAANSTLTLKGEEVRLTDGRFWFDHQWGSGGNPRTPMLRAAAGLTAPAPGGWDWFMAQFDTNRELTVSAQHTNHMKAFYQQTGPTPPGTMTIPVTGKMMDETSHQRDAAGTLSVTDWIKSEATPDRALYPPSHTWYPNRWEFHLGPDMPAEMRHFSMEPIVQTGQSLFFANALQYSEGAVYLKDEHGANIGRGFAESVQYADTLHNQLRLLDMPQTDDIVELFKPPATSLLAKARDLLYLAWPPHALALKRSLDASKTAPPHPGRRHARHQ